MITISLDDEKIVDNFKAIQTLKEFGFSDDEIQEMYCKQVEADKTEKSGGSDA